MSAANRELVTSAPTMELVIPRSLVVVSAEQLEAKDLPQIVQRQRSQIERIKGSLNLPPFVDVTQDSAGVLDALVSYTRGVRRVPSLVAIGQAATDACLDKKARAPYDVGRLVVIGANNESAGSDIPADVRPHVMVLRHNTEGNRTAPMLEGARYVLFDVANKKTQLSLSGTVSEAFLTGNGNSNAADIAKHLARPILRPVRASR